MNTSTTTMLSLLTAATISLGTFITALRRETTNQETPLTQPIGYKGDLPDHNPYIIAHNDPNAETPPAAPQTPRGRPTNQSGQPTDEGARLEVFLPVLARGSSLRVPFDFSSDSNSDSDATFFETSLSAPAHNCSCAAVLHEVCERADELVMEMVAETDEAEYWAPVGGGKERGMGRTVEWYCKVSK